MLLFPRIRSDCAFRRTGDLPRRSLGVGGFTLLELLVVLALVATLGSLLLGGGRYVFASGRSSRARAELAAWAVALESYRSAQGDYPRSHDVVGREAATLLDPWDQPYRFVYKSQVQWTNPG